MTPFPDFKIKAQRFSLPVLMLNSDSLDELEAFLAHHTQKARALLKDAAILIQAQPHMAALPAENIQQILALCFKYELKPVGMIATDDSDHWQQVTDLPLFYPGPAAQARTKLALSEDPPHGDSKSDPTQLDSINQVKFGDKIHQQPVRSGQQVMHPHGSLTLTAPVSATAEVLARDSIHLFAPLKGRALAGIQGNTDARIVCQSFEAELVAIAGHYQLMDEPDPQYYQQAVEIYLENENLVFRKF